MKIGFAGTGFSKVHAQAAQALGLELAAVANHKRASMAAFAQKFGVAHQYDSVEAMLQDAQIDALVVATPNYLHASQTIAALKAGLPVLVEKPMAMNAKEGERMCNAAERSGALLMVAHCWRFHPEVQWLRGQAARLGRILRTKAYSVHVNWGPSGWFAQKRFAGGGAMADMGVHALDTTRYLLGDPQPVSVFARIGTHYGRYDVDDTGVLLIEWDNGATSYIETGWWQPHSDSPEAGAQLYGLKGFGSVFPTRLELPNKAEQKVDLVEAPFAPQAEHGSQEMYTAQMRYFVECIAQQRKPVPGGLEGWTNMKVVDAAYTSSATGKVVSIK
jgi:predicted dehydrogenase